MRSYIPGMPLGPRRFKKKTFWPRSLRMTSNGESFFKAVTRDITAYLAFTLFTVALGPFQFGYHLASLPP